MRTRAWSIGAVITAAVLLTGCTAPAAEVKEDKPTTAAEETTAPASDCPELVEGASVDGTALGVCVTEAMGDSAGYAATMSVLGMDTTARYNPENKAAELVTPMGSLIVIGGESWVKTAAGDWQVSDPESSDPIIAGLSSSAATASQADPVVAAAALTGEYTVTGTGTRLGQEVFLLSGTTEQQGVSVEVTYEITADYVVLATTGATEAAGQEITTSMEITEWDVKQDIVAPL